MAAHSSACEDADPGSLCDCDCAGARHAVRRTAGRVAAAGAVSKRAQAVAHRDGRAAVVSNVAARPGAGARARGGGTGGDDAGYARVVASVPVQPGALAALSDDHAMQLLAQVLRHPRPDAGAAARLRADLDRRDQDRDFVSRWHAEREQAQVAAQRREQLADRDRQFAAAQQARRRAVAAAAPQEDAWLYGPDADQGWVSQWNDEHTDADAAVDQGHAGGTDDLLDVYTAGLDAARGNQTGRTRDILRRRYDEMTAMAYLQAEQSTRGHLLNAKGRNARIDPVTLFSGPRHVADAYASEELQRHWGATGRITFADFTDAALSGAGANRRARSQRSAGREFA